jgi:hypothetical protein
MGNLIVSPIPRLGHDTRLSGGHKRKIDGSK